MNQILAKLPVAVVFAAACALSTGALAQSDANKRALAVRLAHLQEKNIGPMITEQLMDAAAQPLLANWSQRVAATVPPERQPDVRDKLNVELKKFTDSMQKTIEAQLDKSAETALVPVFMDKLTEDDMRTIITYMESPVSTKLQGLLTDAANAWTTRVAEATRPTYDANSKSFDAAANRIVTAAAGGPAPAPSGAAAPRK